MKFFVVLALALSVPICIEAQEHNCTTVPGRGQLSGILIETKESWMMLSEWASSDSGASIRSAQAEAVYDMGSMLVTLAFDSAKLEPIPGLGWRLKEGEKPVPRWIGLPAKLSSGTHREAGGFCSFALVTVEKRKVSLAYVRARAKLPKK